VRNQTVAQEPRAHPQPTQPQRRPRCTPALEVEMQGGTHRSEAVAAMAALGVDSRARGPGRPRGSANARDGVALTPHPNARHCRDAVEAPTDVPAAPPSWLVSGTALARVSRPARARNVPGNTGLCAERRLLLRGGQIRPGQNLSPSGAYEPRGCWGSDLARWKALIVAQRAHSEPCESGELDPTSSTSRPRARPPQRISRRLTARSKVDNIGGLSQKAACAYARWFISARPPDTGA